jgi:hypothetical protein
VIEVDSRLGGDLIPLLVKRATGVDLAQIAAHLATGCAPNLTPTRQRVAAIRFAYPAATGRIERLAIPAAVVHKPHVERFVLTQQVGNMVVSPPDASCGDRLAHWVVLGADVADCHAVLDRLERHFTVDIAALATTALSESLGRASARSNTAAN